MKETKSKQAKAETESKSQGLKNITKSSVWDIQENDVFRLINSGLKDSEVKENLRHYIDIFRAAFMIEEVKGEGAHVKKAYEKQGYKVGNIALDDDTKVLWAVRKRPIMRVTDLTYENIRHISASKLIEVACSGKYDEAKLKKMVTAEGGFVAYLGTNDAYEVEKKALAGDEKCKLLVDAFCYQVSLEISRLAAVVCGKVDAILLTGGIAYSKPWMQMIIDRVGWIAPVKVYKGENEMLALAICGKEVLDGVQVKEYK